jgi:transcriptional regulator with XRE-family HTH domain
VLYNLYNTPFIISGVIYGIEGRKIMYSHNNGFGEFFKEMRLKKGLTLRKFCEINGLDPGNISKIERGHTSPPSSIEKLEQYAKCLGIEPYSDDWYYFFDYAAAANGRIPADMMSDEELVKKLPLVFRTIRGERVSEEELDNLINIIRKA